MSSTPPTMVDSTQDVTGVSAPSHCSPSRFHLDLFSGIGGFALAAKWNGLQTIGFSEIEPYACKILKLHWPDVPNYGDIRNVRNVRADIITGGFPCQPFSVAGKQRGAEDDRHLWPEMCRVIDEARPAWVLGENVPGIIGMELDRVLSDLENLGYACWPVVVPACAVDARHRRDRLWIVAHTRSTKSGRIPGIGREKISQARSNGEAVAHTERVRRGQPAANPDSAQGALHPTQRKESSSRSRSSRETLADTAGERERESANEAVAIATRRNAWQEPRSGMRWPTEPGVGRVVNGLPNRAHRLKGLGNAIVPQIAANLIRWMRESEMTWMGNAPRELPRAEQEKP